MLEADSQHPATTVYLHEYRPPAFLVDHVELDFELADDEARVRSRLSLRRNGDHDQALVLDGEELELQAIALNGRPLDPADYTLTPRNLTLAEVPDRFELATEVLLRPQDNTALSGLYRSGGNFCTQCEAEGFRRITYYIDRPDILARFRVLITAPRERYPVLLSNGNLEAQRDLADGRHQAVWQDPFPKPSYLFALVAGDLAHIEDTYTTTSGRRVRLFVYSQHHNIDKCNHAMASLIKAMRWDEQVYGREYDLDRYMIVAVDDFNMGAMENKGLNIFNSKYVLARPETATDQDYEHIEGVVAHEYFHNWSGNRVTCRDWFQLSLKEGFTVFRDQEFSADMGSRGVKRIQDVNLLRIYQFREDAGPMAHPVRPQSYQEINNFYTVTVYNKGAEVVRMLYHLVGPEGFRRGTDLYFTRHDGEAVTTDDFLAAIGAANEIDLGQFRRWYEQAGTPVLHFDGHYDSTFQRYTLTANQECPATPEQPDKKPFHIPVALALLGRDGRPLPLHLDGFAAGLSQVVVAVRERRQQFVFEQVPEPPVASLLRGFSAPVKVQFRRDPAELYFLWRHDDDPFSRWEAGQQLAVQQLLRMVSAQQRDQVLTVDSEFVAAIRTALVAREPDLALQTELLRLPGEAYLAEFVDPIDPQAIHVARQTLRRTLAQELETDWLAVYEDLREPGRYEITPQAIGRRALKNLCLDYLLELNHRSHRLLAMRQLESAQNMTDAIAALAALVNTDCEERDLALQSFYARWHDDPLVVDKWLGLQATSRLGDTLSRVRRLTQHPAFNGNNPNRVRALIGSFAQANPVHFHEPGGAGYAFVADQVLALDRINPQIAARLAGVFNLWRRYEPGRRKLMRAQISRIDAAAKLSRDLREIVSKSLSGDP